MYCYNLDELRKFLESKKIIDSGTECWLNPNQSRDKYVRFTFDSISENAHRLSAIAYLNFLPDSCAPQTEICHKRICPYKGCFNPEHLYIGTHGTNRSDVWAMRSNCIHGVNTGCKICIKVKQLRKRAALGFPLSQKSRKFLEKNQWH